MVDDYLLKKSNILQHIFVFNVKLINKQTLIESC